MIPSPADSGCALSEGKLSAHMTDHLPAPLAMVEMSVCKCDKSKWFGEIVVAIAIELNVRICVAANTVRTLSNLCELYLHELRTEEVFRKLYSDCVKEAKENIVGQIPSPSAVKRMPQEFSQEDEGL